MKRNSREKLIQNIKDCGQSLIDNAENIIGNYKYLGEITIYCFPNEHDEPPHIEVTNKFYPENYVEKL
jgi:hypothetical protein